MKMIVGLGNIGKEYRDTRHNAGFLFLEALREELKLDFREEPAFRGRVAKAQLEGETVLFLMPSTYMNDSGSAVQSLAAYYKVWPEDILVVYDDMDLPVGEVRWRKKGSSGGQKGMADIIEKMGTQEIPRLKIGIGKGDVHHRGKDYVLGTFRKEERSLIDKVIALHREGVPIFLREGIEAAMNRMNGKQAEAEGNL